MTKITGAQSPMMTKKYTKFEKDHRKMAEKNSGQTVRQGDSSIPPQLVGGGYNKGQ